MKGRIKRVAYAGWAGIEYDDFELDDGSFTGLIGNSGAGKTSLLTCFAYALLPDRADLALQPISSVSDPRESGKDPLAAWISTETNYAYVAIDIAARTGKRLLAGVYAEVKGNKAELSPWTIEDAPPEVALRELLVIEDGEEEFTPDIVQLREALAKRGYTLRRHATVAEYGEKLYEAGVSPTNLRDRDDRALYGKLIQSSFHGGISAEVASSIKDYILPERPIRDVLLRAEEVTAQVARSKRALEHAKKQIAILHTIFVVGRTATVEATRALMLAHHRAVAAREAARIERDRLVANEATAREAVGSFTKQLEVSNDAHQTIKRNLEDSMKKLEADFTLHEEAVERCKGELAKATERQDGFIAGERVWKRVAGVHAHQSYDAVSTVLNAEIEAIHEAKGVLEAEKKGLQNEQAALATAAGDPKVTALAERVGGTPLVEALGGVGEQEALRLEVMLGGVTAGLSGVEPSQLERVKPGSDLPPFFWIGEKVPQARGSTEIGEWIVVRGPDGWFVTDKARRPVFGATARAARRERLGEAIRKLDERIGLKREESVLANKLRTELLENREVVLTYLSNRESAIELANEVERARKALNTARGEKLATERVLRESRQKLTDAVETHAKQTAGLRADIGKQREAQSQAAEKIEGAQAALDKAEERVEAAAADLNEGKAALDTHWTYMAEQAAAPGEYDPVEQTKALAQLGEALADDPSRQRRFEEADARRPSSCLYLWPLLLDVVRNHIPADVADATGEDYLSEMQRKRDFLAKELKGYEDDMREHASSVYEAINSKIREQVRAGEALVQVGREPPIRQRGRNARHG